jgi:DNA-binding response OmpR family regulator
VPSTSHAPVSTATEPHRTAHEHDVLRVLYEQRHRVVGRLELTRSAGLAGLSQRRCDSVLVGVRRTLGPDSIITVRSRGWRLAPHAVACAAELLERAEQ